MIQRDIFLSKESRKAMKERLEAINDWVSTPTPPAWVKKRNQYMRGDLVLKNGEPHLWTNSDYYLTEIEMESIEDVPLTAIVLYYNGFKKDAQNDITAFDYTFDDGEEFCGVTFPKDTDGGLVVAHPLDYSTQLSFVFQDTLSIAKFQHLLRDAGCYNLERELTYRGNAISKVLAAKQ